MFNNLFYYRFSILIYSTTICPPNTKIRLETESVNDRKRDKGREETNEKGGP